MSWRKRLAIWRNRLYLYPAPEPMPRARLFWIATGLVALAAILFSAYFIFIHLGRQSAYITPAEDLGIMDQAIWSLTHGQLFHQTICNTVSDTNCYGLDGISRFAIHFEPVLFLVSLFYFVLPGPNTLLILQTLVVASGAFPAFWLARLRLRNEFAAVGIAVLYLLYPALQQAEIFDFHAVTFTCSLLLFTLYFMYTRRTVWLFVFAILSMACKEEIPAVIAFFGLWSMLFQQRWRTGLALIILSFGWLGLTLAVYHFASPTGHPLLASRYAYLGSGPVQILRNVLTHPLSLLHQHVIEGAHRQYLRILLAPAGYFPLLAPWVFVLAVPSLALNLFSSDPNQYLGIFQYSAEIVPVLIFSTIEAIVLIVWAAQWFTKRVIEQRTAQQVGPASEVSQTEQTGQTEQVEQPRPVVPGPRFALWVQPVLLALLVCFALFNVVRQDFTYGALPFSKGFAWPHTTTHQKLAQQFIDMIPATASVSAQSSLVPHISERTNIYLFPYGDTSADYVFLDVTSFTYPFDSYPYTLEVKKVLLSGKYGVVAAQDGYLLLKRGLPPPGISPYSASQTADGVIPNLPDAFCSFVRVSSQDIPNALQVDFTPSNGSDVSLVGYNVAPPSSFEAGTRFMQVTAYWKVSTVHTPPLRILTTLINQKGKELFSSIDFPAVAWCPVNSWKPGTIVRTVSSPLYIGTLPVGLAHVGLALLPFDVPFGTMRTVTERVPLHIVSAPGNVTLFQGTNTLQIDSFTIVP